METSEIDLNSQDSVRVEQGKKSVAYFCKNEPVRINKKLIAELKKNASAFPDKNLRICLHDTPEALFQNMIILERKNAYYRPHKHLDKGESFHIIEGRMAVFVFNHKGEVVDSCILEPAGAIVYKVAVNSFHAIMPLTDLIIYHEAKPGPFLGQRDSIFPEWSAEDSDEDGVDRYKQMLFSVLERNRK
jgi:cupin fold WbuC family metalloprotein